MSVTPKKLRVRAKKAAPVEFTRTSLVVPVYIRERIAELAHANNITMGYLIEAVFSSIADDAVKKALKAHSGTARRTGRPPKDFFPNSKFDLTGYRLGKK